MGDQTRENQHLSTNTSDGPQEWENEIESKLPTDEKELRSLDQSATLALGLYRSSRFALQKIKGNSRFYFGSNPLRGDIDHWFRTFVDDFNGIINNIDNEAVVLINNIYNDNDDIKNQNATISCLQAKFLEITNKYWRTIPENLEGILEIINGPDFDYIFKYVINSINKITILKTITFKKLSDIKNPPFDAPFWASKGTPAFDMYAKYKLSQKTETIFKSDSVETESNRIQKAISRKIDWFKNNYRNYKSINDLKNSPDFSAIVRVKKVRGKNCLRIDEKESASMKSGLLNYIKNKLNQL